MDETPCLNISGSSILIFTPPLISTIGGPYLPPFHNIHMTRTPYLVIYPLIPTLNTFINSPSQISASCSSWLQQHWARQEHHSFVPTYDWLIVYLYDYNNYMGILLSAFGKEHFVCSVQTENSTLSSQLWCIEHLDDRISGWRG